MVDREVLIEEAEEYLVEVSPVVKAGGYAALAASPFLLQKGVQCAAERGEKKKAQWYSRAATTAGAIGTGVFGYKIGKRIVHGRRAARALRQMEKGGVVAFPGTKRKLIRTVQAGHNAKLFVPHVAGLGILTRFRAAQTRSLGKASPEQYKEYKKRSRVYHREFKRIRAKERSKASFIAKVNNIPDIYANMQAYSKAKLPSLTGLHRIQAGGKKRRGSMRESYDLVGQAYGWLEEAVELLEIAPRRPVLDKRMVWDLHLDRVRRQREERRAKLKKFSKKHPVLAKVAGVMGHVGDALNVAKTGGAFVTRFGRR